MLEERLAILLTESPIAPTLTLMSLDLSTGTAAIGSYPFRDLFMSMVIFGVWKSPLISSFDLSLVFSWS
jgi:hypothetical protein